MKYKSSLFPLLFGIVLSLFVKCGSDNDRIKSQQEIFCDKIGLFQKDYEEWDGNDLQQETICDSMRFFIDNYGNIDKWTGVVKRVSNTLGDSWVDVDFENDYSIDLKLWPEGDILGNKALDEFLLLKPKDKIVFSGKIIREMSLTNYGMMSNPEIKIEPTQISKMN